MRSRAHVLLFAASATFLIGSTATCDAQSAFGLGARLSMVRADIHSEADAVRFLGGQMRARMSPHSGLEVSLDVRSERDQTLTRKVRDMPLQASLLFFPVAGPFSPYLLGGPGWYSHRIETLAGDDVIDSETTRKFGWHAGFGAELRLGNHAGVHADYRYTFLHFGDDGQLSGSLTPERPTHNSGFGTKFLPSYDGSMWTAGVTVYF